MRLCLTCFHIWPSGALFCGRCGRSFGHRLCQRRHESPPSARVCTKCGSHELTTPTLYLSLGCLSGLVALLLMMFDPPPI